MSRETSPAGNAKDVAVAGRVHAAVEQVCIIKWLAIEAIDIKFKLTCVGGVEALQ